MSPFCQSLGFRIQEKKIGQHFVPGATPGKTFSDGCLG